jgi:hypothetical protein
MAVFITLLHSLIRIKFQWLLHQQETTHLLWLNGQQSILSSTSIDILQGKNYGAESEDSLPNSLIRGL